MISAKIICDSRDTRGNRLTTFVLTFPRYILAEFNTHRMFTRSSASSRAMPFKKVLKTVEENPFIPIKWMKDHSGMQGTEYFTDEDKFHFEIGNHIEEKTSIEVLRYNWLEARNEAIRYARRLNEQCNLTKQLCNRLLEAYMWHTVLLTATEFENFFSLRANEAADIHLQDLAYKMLEEYNSSVPTRLGHYSYMGGDPKWHIPFGDTFDLDRLEKTLLNINQRVITDEMMNSAKIKVATARCARISYNTFEGKDDYEADLKLHDRLLNSGHWSAFEHCAIVMDDVQYKASHGNTKCIDGHIIQYEQGWCGNFRGFIQYRKLFNNENRKDERVSYEEKN